MRLTDEQMIELLRLMNEDAYKIEESVKKGDKIEQKDDAFTYFYDSE